MTKSNRALFLSLAFGLVALAAAMAHAGGINSVFGALALPMILVTYFEARHAMAVASGETVETPRTATITLVMSLIYLVGVFVLSAVAVISDDMLALAASILLALMACALFVHRSEEQIYVTVRKKLKDGTLFD